MRGIRSLRRLGQRAARHPATFGYFMAFIILGMSDAVVGPTLGILSTQVSVGLSAISGIFASRSIGYVIGALGGARLYDRFSGHSMLACALVLVAVSLATIPWIGSLWLLLAAFAILGVAQAMVDVGGNTLLIWTYGDRVDPIMNALHFCFGAGAFLAPALVGLASRWQGGATAPYMLIAVLIAPLAVSISRRRSPLSPNRSAARLSWRHLPKGVLLFILLLFLYVGAEVSMGGWLASYVQVLGFGDQATAAYMSSAFWGAIMVGRLLSVPLATRTAPGRLLKILLLAGIIGTTVGIIWRGSALALWVTVLSMGLALAPVFPTVMALAERRIAITGEITGVLFVGGSLGAMVIPWIIGQLFEPVGPSSLLIVVLISLILALAAADSAARVRPVVDTGGASGEPSRAN